MPHKTIKELEQQIEQLSKTIEWQDKLIERCKQTMKEIDKGVYENHYSDNPDLSNLIHRIADLELMLFGEKPLELPEKNTKPEATTKPAGRKKHNAAWQQAYNDWLNLYIKGESVDNICKTLNISTMTHYRYKKEYEKQ